MPRLTTFTDLLREQARKLGDADAHVFLADTAGRPGVHRTGYSALDREARSVAAQLLERHTTRAPVLLAYPAGPEFLPALAGCFYAGAIAVPTPLPDGQGGQGRRVESILRDSGARLVLTCRSAAAEVTAWLQNIGAPAEVLVTDGPDTTDGLPGRARPVRVTADDVCFVQYTSGSTARPRGAAITHANLLANQRALANALRTTDADRWGGWLPHFHDMGLVANLLHPLWLGTSSVTMSPMSFLKRPWRWLQAITDHGITVSGGPNFAYDLCVRRVGDAQRAALDLSGWRVAFNGAEPVRAATIDAFGNRFAPAGFRRAAHYPCYGLAEATLVVSGGTPSVPPARLCADTAALERHELVPAPAGGEHRVLVSSGRVRDFDLAIVDPAGGRLPDGGIGEIHVRGDSVAAGYWRRPELTAETFGASAGGTGGYLRTGDLGALLDGELYVTGRAKDLLILNGRNIYPQDIEAVLQADAATVSIRTAALAVATDREHLVVVQEVRGALPQEEADARIAAVREVVAGAFDVPARSVVLVRAGGISTTTSGKLRRAETRSRLLRGLLPVRAAAVHPALAAHIPATAADPARAAAPSAAVPATAAAGPSATAGGGRP